MVNQKLQSYVDLLVIETILSDPRITKTAQSGVVSSLIQTVYNWASEQFNEFKASDQKAEMIFNFLIPGILGGFGFPVLGFLAKLAQVLFGIDFAAILKSIGSSLKNVISSGGKVSDGEVDSVVSNIFSAHMPPDPTEDDMAKFVSPNMIKTEHMTLREANLFKIALTDYVSKNPDVNLINPEINIKFAAGLFGSALATFIGSRGKTVKILISLVGWIFKTTLYAGGYMAVGSIIGKLIGHSTSDETTSTEPTGSKTTNVPMASPRQNVFPVSSSYAEENFNGPASRWTISGDVSNIDSMLVAWTDEIYPTVKGHEDIMKSCGTFQTVVNIIKSYNQGGPPSVIFMPRQWKSRKQVIDLFMGEVALKAPSSSPSAPATLGKPQITPIPNATAPETKETVAL